MAKSIDLDLKFKSNGEMVMGKLTVSAKQFAMAVNTVRDRSTKTLESVFNTCSAMSVSLQAGASGIQQLAAPVMEFDQAMRAANTMASKGAKDFENLKKQVKELSKEVPVARDVLANGLYQTISNGVPEDNWLSFLKTSAESSVGGLANLDEAVKVTSTLIKNYGLEWCAAGDIQDKIQLTAKNGVTSFELIA